MTREDINIEMKCCACRNLVPDHWLFETTVPGDWVCGDCVDIDSDDVTPISSVVEFLRNLREGTN